MRNNKKKDVANGLFKVGKLCLGAATAAFLGAMGCSYLQDRENKKNKKN